MAVKTKDLDKNLTVEGLTSEPISAKGKNTVYFSDLTKNDIKNLKFSIIDNYLLITNSDETKGIKLSNYAGIKYVKTDKEGKTFNLTDLISENLINNTAVISSYSKKLAATGATNYNDTFNYAEVELTKVIGKGKNKQIVEKTSADKGITVNGKSGNDVIIGSKYSDVLAGGSGNDTITGSLGNDTIAGGLGENVINYAKGDGDDIVSLTKGEKFTLNMTDLNLADLTIEAVNKNKDLKISYDKDGVKGSVTLKNFASKDVTNNANAKKKIDDSSSVKLFANGEEVNLREVAIKAANGTWHDDIIDQSDYENSKKKGLTLNALGGNDTITGSKYSDTISGGKGDDTINAGLGSNTIKFAKGDGHDVIENGGGVDTLSFASGTKITTKFQDNNLVITYGTLGDTVTLKDFKDGHSVQYVKVGSSKKSIENYYPQPEVLKINGVNFFEGTDEPNNIVVKAKGPNRIYGGAGNDTIKTNNSYTDNYIYGGAGDDTIISGAGHDIIFGGGGDNKIHFTKGSGTDYFYEDNANNTLVFDTVTFTADNNGNVTGLGNLKLSKAPGYSMGYYNNCNLKISGYGTTKNGLEDAVYIQNYFNLNDYDFTGFKLQDKNGRTINIEDAVSLAVDNTLIYTSFNRKYWATDSGETIYVKTEDKGNDTVIQWGIRLIQIQKAEMMLFILAVYIPVGKTVKDTER